MSKKTDVPDKGKKTTGAAGGSHLGPRRAVTGKTTVHQADGTAEDLDIPQPERTVPPFSDGHPITDGADDRGSYISIEEPDEDNDLPPIDELEKLFAAATGVSHDGEANGFEPATTGEEPPVHKTEEVAITRDETAPATEAEPQEHTFTLVEHPDKGFTMILGGQKVPDGHKIVRVQFLLSRLYTVLSDEYGVKPSDFMGWKSQCYRYLRLGEDVDEALLYLPNPKKIKGEPEDKEPEPATEAEPLEVFTKADDADLDTELKAGEQPAKEPKVDTGAETAELKVEPEPVEPAPAPEAIEHDEDNKPALSDLMGATWDDDLSDSAGFGDPPDEDLDYGQPNPWRWAIGLAALLAIAVLAVLGVRHFQPVDNELVTSEPETASPAPVAEVEAPVEVVTEIPQPTGSEDLEPRADPAEIYQPEPTVIEVVVDHEELDAVRGELARFREALRHSDATNDAQQRQIDILEKREQELEAENSVLTQAKHLREVANAELMGTLSEVNAELDDCVAQRDAEPEPVEMVTSEPETASPAPVAEIEAPAEDPEPAPRQGGHHGSVPGDPDPQRQHLLRQERRDACRAPQAAHQAAPRAVAPLTT